MSNKHNNSQQNAPVLPGEEVAAGTAPAVSAQAAPADETVPPREKAAYILFTATVALAIVAALALPPLLNLTGAQVERTVMVSMAPILIAVIILLR